MCHIKTTRFDQTWSASWNPWAAKCQPSMRWSRSLRTPKNPPPMERYNLNPEWCLLYFSGMLFSMHGIMYIYFIFSIVPRMVQDLQRIIAKMETSFKTLAGYLTDIKVGEYDKDPTNPKLMEFLILIHLSQQWVAQSIFKPCIHDQISTNPATFVCSYRGDFGGLTKLFFTFRYGIAWRAVAGRTACPQPRCAWIAWQKYTIFVLLVKVPKSSSHIFHDLIIYANSIAGTQCSLSPSSPSLRLPTGHACSSSSGFLGSALPDLGSCEPLPISKGRAQVWEVCEGQRLETMDGSLGFKHLVVTKNQGSFPWYLFRPICRLCVAPIEMHCRAANAAHQGGDWQSHHQVETVHLQGGLYSRPHLQVEQQDIWVCSRSQQVGRNDRFVGRLWPHCWCFHRSCLDHVLQGFLSYIYRSCKNICSSFFLGWTSSIYTYSLIPACHSEARLAARITTRVANQCVVVMGLFLFTWSSAPLRTHRRFQSWNRWQKIRSHVLWVRLFKKISFLKRKSSTTSD